MALSNSKDTKKNNDSLDIDKIYKAIKKEKQNEPSEESDHEEFYGRSSHKKGEEGEGPWLISYADMMTLLMGFFALTASFSKPDIEKFEKVKQAASEYFGGEYEQPYKELEETIKEIVQKENLQDQVKIASDTSGVTITFTGTFFFDSGEFVVKPQATEVMDKMIVAIGKKALGINAMVEGHTDSRPISHPIIASNWELSAIRAARVAKLFELRGFKKDQLIIMGWGETKPVVPDVNQDGTFNIENQAKNRRVVIKLFRASPK